MNIKLKENERIDELEYKNLKIIQNEKGFCFGMDSILLTDFAKNIKDKANVIDLGTGTGIISILLCGKTKLSKIYGIEIQKDVADMADRSRKLNNLEERFIVINDNIKNINDIFSNVNIDVVITNPPYKKKNTGIINEEGHKLISRHEITADLEDFIRIASLLLKQNGEFYMVHRPERLVDIIELLRKYKLEPKIIRFVYPKITKSPNLILIKSVKNAKSFLKVEKPLVIYNENGVYTDEVLEIYNIESRK